MRVVMVMVMVKQHQYLNRQLRESDDFEKERHHIEYEVAGREYVGQCFVWLLLSRTSF